MKKLTISILFFFTTIACWAQQTNKERAVAFYVAINKNNAQALESLILPNFEVYFASQKQTYQGTEFFRFVYETHQRVKGFRQDIKDIFGEGNWVCVTGGAVGTDPKTGKRFETEFTSVLEFDDNGLIKTQNIQDNRNVSFQQRSNLVKN
ncbi:MAG: nuclear transport factor 2 family protein [Spirosomataceae bacterium]